MSPVERVKVLIVDDDPLDREIFRRFLAEHAPREIDVAEADTGESAIALVREFQPHCMLLDVNLPDMSGLELLASLKDSSERFPCAVVILTSLRDERVAVAAMKTGIMDYLGKSETNADALLYAIDNAIAKYQMLSQIEEQRRALEASEQRYRMLTEAIPQMVWTATPEGSLQYANRRWYEFSGWPTNLEWGSLLAYGEEADFQAAWRSAIAGTAAFEMEQRLLRASDEQLRWHLIRAVPMRGATGQVRAWFGTCTDIEERKRAEATVLEKQKLESLGLLAGGIAHDFNNLLVGILGGASHAVDALPESHALQPILQNVMLAGERAAHLVRQMLAYAGKGTFIVQRLNLNELVRETCDLIRASIPKTVQVKLESDPQLPAVETDTGQMQQVIMNLILNAAEAIPEGSAGRVTVRTFARWILEDQAKEGFIGSELDKGLYAALEVRDSGCGMDEETKSKIFDPFFSTKFAGRGLGLSAVQGILRTNRGAIQVESTPGKGSTFRVLLPAVSAQSNHPQGPQGAQRSDRNATILLVDDEEIVRDTARAILQHFGYRVLLAEGGLEALQILQRHPDEIALVLLDLNMPEMDGREVLRRFRSAAPSVPVLICSGYAESELNALTDLAPEGTIPKPFTVDGLLGGVEAFLSHGREVSGARAGNAN